MQSVIRWLVDHATTVMLLVLCVFVGGALSYVDLPRESAPDIQIPVVLVSTPYVGVSPEDVESLVTIPIENELASLRDVKVMKSTSAEGVSIVSLEFVPEVVIDDALQKVRDAVSKAKPKLPADAEEPAVSEISFSDIPVVLVTIAGEVDQSVLKRLADDLEEAATRIPGVLDAKVTGGVEREIRVEVIPQRLSHYGLALYDVTNAIGDENVNIPGGTVEGRGASVLLRVPGEFSSVDELERVAIKRVGDRPVFIRDVARVVDGTAERETYSRMNGRPAVTLSVTKRSGANILEVAQAVKDLTAERSAAWPAGVTYRVLGDQSEGIADIVTDLQNNIITALILVVGVIVFFMGLRNSLFVALAIPLSMMSGFLVLSSLGFTLNMVVLFSLMIALGMLVDNAIVVVENVYRHREMGRDRRDAAVIGTSEVAIAVAASTATTIAAFLPMAFWPGIMGEFMGFLPKTVIIVLSASLVVAVGALPVFMRMWMARPLGGVDPSADEDQMPPLGPLMRGYLAVLEFSIRHRYLSFGAGVATLLLTFVAYGFLNHGVEMFPTTEPERANIFVRASEGTDLDTTDRVVRQVEALLVDTENVDVWVAETGVAGDGNALGPSSSAPNQARVTVDFRPSTNNARPGEALRVESTLLTIQRLREQLRDIPGAEIRIEKEEMGPPVGKPIAVEVRGPDFHGVGEVAAAFRRVIRGIDGVTDLADDYRVGRPELALRVDRGAAKRVGVSTAGVGDTVRTVVAGTKASTLREGDDEYDIVVRLAPEYRSDLQSVLDLRVPGREDTSPDTFPVPLSAVATYALDGGSGSIRHVDQDLVVTIEGDVAEGFNEVEVQEKVLAAMAAFELPPGYQLQLAGSTEEQEEAQAFLGKAFVIGCALILLVLVTQFDSLWMPVIILVTVVLSLIGVLWGLVLTGTPFGIIMTGIGVISLAGVVVNNAIVLLDYVQQLQARGKSVHDSLILAGVTRFRPVMLTAITTTLGLVPMAAGISVDFVRLRLVLGSTSAQWWGPMAVAVIFGLSVATVLTLVMVPTLYSIYDDFDRLRVRVMGSAQEGSGQAAASAAATAVALLVALGAAGPAQAATLEDAWRAARGHATGFELLDEQTRQVGLQRSKALASLQPQVSASATHIINEFEVKLDFADSFPDIPGFELPEQDPIVVQRKNFWQANFTVSQRLFSGSALPALQSAIRAHQGARLDQTQAERELELAVARAYYSVLLAREAERLAAENLEAAEGQRELARRQEASGLATRRTALSAELGVARADRDRLNAQQQRVAAEEALHRLTGLPRDEALELPRAPGAPTSLQDALGALEHRPDVAAADRQLQAATLATRASDMRWLPTVDGQFQYNWTQNLGFQERPGMWQIALVGSWTLWDGGLRLAESAEYRSQRRQAELQRRAVREEAEEQIRVAWEQWLASNRALEAVDHEVALAEENARLSEQSFAVGAATWLEVREARLSLTSASLSAIESRMNRDLAALALQLATGEALAL